LFIFIFITINILFKLNRVNIVKLSREIRVNLGQNIAYGLTLSNKRKNKSDLFYSKKIGGICFVQKNRSD